MNTILTEDKIKFFQENGFVIQENFLNDEELTEWREAVTEAVSERNGLKIPGQMIKAEDDDGNNEDPEYFSNVFDQLLNLWQTNDRIRK
ncbi:MAG: phytanoyl-CoA dioxygenase family protein, partial [Cytophagales bacterium]|nr:phytanoyl-CoA dioxygenase family protein [Cytophagales bacterium]